MPLATYGKLLGFTFTVFADVEVRLILANFKPGTGVVAYEPIRLEKFHRVGIVHGLDQVEFFIVAGGSVHRCILGLEIRIVSGADLKLRRSR